MNALWSVLSYVVAFILIVVVGVVLEFPFFLLLPLLRGAKWLSPLVRVANETVAVVLAVYLLSIVAQSTPLRVSVLMVLLPFFMHLRNDRQRIANVRAGRSGALAQLQAAGKEDLYDQRNDLHTEYGSLIGHVLGFTLAFSFLLRGAPFL